MSPKDRRIIDANPGVAPYDLQMSYGLSKGGFDELVKLNDTQIDNMLKAGKPTLRANPAMALPATPHTMPHLQISGEQVTLRSKGGSGHGALMDRGQAMRMVQKYPHQYEIG